MDRAEQSGATVSVMTRAEALQAAIQALQNLQRVCADYDDLKTARVAMQAVMQLRTCK